MGLLLNSAGNRLPQYPARVRRSDPITKGLVFLSIQSTNFDIISSVAGVGTGSGFTRETIPAGVASRLASTSSTIAFGAQDIGNVTGPITCISLGVIDNTGADQTALSKCVLNGATDTPFDFGITVGGAVRLGRASSSYHVWAGTVAVTTGKQQMIAATQGADIGIAPKFYVDAVIDTGTAISLYGGGGSGNAGPNAAPIRMQNRGDLSTQWRGVIAFAAVFNRELSAAELARIKANPAILVETSAARRLLFDVPAGGTNTPINPAVGALALTGYSPTIAQSVNQAFTPGAGLLALTSYAPSVAQSSAAAINPNAGAITFNGFAPTISQPKSVISGAGSLTITGFAPTIAQVTTTSINPGAGTITATGYAPTLAQTANISISPLTGVITLSGFGPTVFRQSPILVTPGYGSITFTGYSPTIFQGLPNLYPVFNRTILMRANPADNQAAKTATQVYNVNGSTQFQLYVIRPDGTEFTSYPALGVVDLATVDQGIFAAGKYSVYTFSSGDLSLPGEYLMRHAYQDTLGQTISQVHTFTITTQ